MNLGILGIGIMGEAITRRLLDQGRTVTVWNLEPERLATVVPHGAHTAASPAAVAEASEVVLMCVLHTAAVERCVFADDGIARAKRPPRLLIDLSTADPAATEQMAARLRRETATAWVDAPVSGGPVAARSGTLTIMAGGEAGDTEQARAVLADLAANFTHMGPVGAGQRTKLINQAIVGAGYVLMAEALVMAEAAGIDAARLPDCLAGGAADSTLLRTIFRQMQKREFEPPKSYARQLLKDMKAVHEFGAALGLDVPVIEAAVERYAAYVEAGNAMRDSASIVRAYEAAR